MGSRAGARWFGSGGRVPPALLVPTTRDLCLLGQGSHGKRRRVLQGCSVGNWSSAFGTFAETLQILITDVNDNTPLFLPISETFGEQPGLVCPVGSSLHPHMLCHTAQQWGPSPARTGL